MRRINTGKKLTEEHKKKISDSNRGQKYHDDAFKQKVSERFSHKVIRDDGVEFSSVKSAAESIGVQYSAISNSIRRGQRSGGYYWKYAE